MANMTGYPYQTSLGMALYQIFIDQVLAVFNAGIAAQLPELNPPLVFPESSIIYGNKRDISEPTVCIYIPSRTMPDKSVANGLFVHNFQPLMSIRLPYVSPAASGVPSNNYQEYYTRIQDLFVDTIASVFTLQANLYVKPYNADGDEVLPAGNDIFMLVKFRDAKCEILQTDAASQLTYIKTDVTLTSLISTSIYRDGV